MDITEQVVVNSEDREEGEIIDDDIEFEDISDNSIIEDYIIPGKSVSNKDRLRALSLSSISDVEVKSVIGSCNKRKHQIKHRRKSKTEKRQSYLKRHKTICITSDTDDSDNEYAVLDKRTQRKLKEAICINTTDSDIHHNSLRTRLRAMININEESSDSATTIIYDNADNVPDCSKTILDHEFSEFLQETEETCDVIENDKVDLDPELQQLRIEALKTAILNKYKHKKKRKANVLQENVLSDTSQKSDILETNKENDQVVSNLDNTDYPNKKLCTLQTSDNLELREKDLSPMEEDEDVLRALLLASMSRKMTENSIEISGDNTHKQSARVLQSSDQLIKNNEHLHLFNKAKITSESILNRPFVKCNLKNYGTELKRIVPDINLANKKIIPQNRKIFTLPPVKPLIINVNEDSDTDDDLFSISSSPEKPIDKELKVFEQEIKSVPFEIQNSVEQFLKEERAKVESKTLLTTQPKLNTNNVNTKLQTNNLQITKTPSLNNNSNNLKKMAESKTKRFEITKPKINIKNYAVVNKSVLKLHSNKTPENSRSKKSIVEKSAVKLLPKNKQIEYQTLLLQLKNAEKKPRVRKLSQKNTETLKKVSKLTISKADLDKNHKFEEKKKEILRLQTTLKDIQENSDGSITKEDNNKKQYTSTPIKDHSNSLEKLEESIITVNTTLNNPKSPVEKIKLPPFVINKEDVVRAETKPKSSVKVSKCKSSNLQNGVKPKISTLKAIFVKCDKAEQKGNSTTMKDYISPLGNHARSDMKIDPLGVMCPYEVDGSCRDPECTYTHYN